MVYKEACTVCRWSIRIFGLCSSLPACSSRMATEEECRSGDGREKCNDVFRQRFGSYFKYITALLKDWGGSASIYASVSAERPDLFIYSDAVAKLGMVH